MAAIDERKVILKEILDIAGNKPHGRYAISPRVGKTKIAIEIIKKNNPKSILWVTPLEDLAKIDIPNEFSLWKAKKYLKKLKTSTWKSLDKVKGHFDIIVLDEEQNITENNIKNLLNGSLTYKDIISMTGTPTKDYDKKLLYGRLNLYPLYKLPIEEAIQKNILANYNINVIYLNLSNQNNIKVTLKDGRSFFTSEYNQYRILNNRAETAIFKRSKDVTHRILQRMRFIYDNKSKLEVARFLKDNLEGRKIIFTNTSKQADSLSKYTYHSKTSGINLRKFLDNEIDELVMVNKGGTGVTFRSVDNFIISQIDSDNNGSTTQKICRVLLKQKKDYVANIWIIVLAGTKDTEWLESVLDNFDRSKVKNYTLEQVKNLIYENKSTNSNIT